MVTVADVRHLLDYDKSTGLLTWRRHHGRALAGQIAGTPHRKGYVVIKIDGRQYKAHRLAWLWEFGTWPADQLDHVNGDPADNRLRNLREATNAQNCQNRRTRSDNSSGRTGVSHDARRCIWVAYINVNGRRINLGRFPTFDEAVDARELAEAEYHPYRAVA